MVERPGATPVHIVPGLIQRHGLPNVMRGEETQVRRAARRPRRSGCRPADRPARHALRGSAARNGQVTHFDTFMTGEVY